MDKTEVGHFGIHWASSDIAFLEQGGSSTSAYDGLDIPSPFSVRVHHAQRCNHRIDLQQAPPPGKAWSTFRRDYLPDPLIQYVLPRPKEPGQVAFLANPHLSLLRALCRLSNPVRLPMVPLWAIPARDVITELQRTNVQPLILTDIRPSDVGKLLAIVPAAATLPRQLLLVGNRLVAMTADTYRIDTHLTMADLALPWEAIGAEVVRRIMLRRPLNG